MPPISLKATYDYPTMWVSSTHDMDWLAAYLYDYGQVIRTDMAGLPDGDIRWITPRGETVLVEVKTTHEALGSFKSHRLFDQMYRVCASADIPIFLAYGHLKPTKEGWCYYVTKRKLDPKNPLHAVRVRYDGFMNYMARLNNMGCIAQHVPDSRTYPARKLLVHRIVSLWKWTQKESSKSFYPAIPKPHVLSTTDFVRIRKMQTTEGIGQELAIRLLGMYGGSPYECIKDLMENDPKELKKKFAGLGIGPRKIEQIRKEWSAP